MVDEFNIPNMAGASKKFNEIKSKVNDTLNNVISNIDADASTAASTLTSNITDVQSKVRSLVSEMPALPNINLQSQLSSLSSLTAGLPEHTELLTKITNDFGSALTSSGFSLDTLVSDASSAFGSSKSLSGIVPNFEKAADGLSEPFEKAMATLLPEVEAIKEELSTLNTNESFTKLISERKTLLDKFKTSTSLPEEISGLFVPTTKSNKVVFDDFRVKILEEFQPQTFIDLDKNMLGSGVTIAKAVTTAANAILSDGNRANISKDGFANKIIKTTEFFKSAGTSVTLKREPVRVTAVHGYTTSYKEGKTSLQILPPFLAILGLFDSYSVEGKTVTINNDKRTYDGHPDTGVVYVVNYVYHNDYDAEFVQGT